MVVIFFFFSFLLDKWRWCGRSSPRPGRCYADGSGTLCPVGSRARVLATSESFEIAQGFRCSSAVLGTLQPQQLHGQPAQLYGPLQSAHFASHRNHVVAVDHQVITIKLPPSIYIYIYLATIDGWMTVMAVFKTKLTLMFTIHLGHIDCCRRRCCRL